MHTFFKTECYSTLNRLQCSVNATFLSTGNQTIPTTGFAGHWLYQAGWASPVAQLVKNLPAVQETWVRSLGWEDPLEKGMATRPSILAWRIPWAV